MLLIKFTKMSRILFRVVRKVKKSLFCLKRYKLRENQEIILIKIINKKLNFRDQLLRIT